MTVIHPTVYLALDVTAKDSSIEFIVGVRDIITNMSTQQPSLKISGSVLCILANRYIGIRHFQVIDDAFHIAKKTISERSIGIRIITHFDSHSFDSMIIAVKETAKIGSLLDTDGVPVATSKVNIIL